MKLERKALLWMPATNRRKKNQEMKKTPNTKEKKERTRKEKETKSLKELITFPLPQKKKPPPKKIRQDTQAHGEVPLLEDST